MILSFMVEKNMEWIKQHFLNYRKRRPWDFCLRITFEGLIISLAVAAILFIFGFNSFDNKMGFRDFFFGAVIFAPVSETLIFQAFPVWIARHCYARFSVQILSSVIPFAFVHAFRNFTTGICAGLITGFYLAFTYVHWREHHRWTACWVTCVSHAIHNGVLLVMFLF